MRLALGSSLLLLVPAMAVSQPALLRRYLEQAGRAGFATPEPLEAVPIPAPRGSAVARPAAAPIYGPVYGSGRVDGSAFVWCRQDRSYPELVQAQVPLMGSIEVSGPDGTRGSVMVQGSAWLSGWCRHGQVELTGSAPVSGSGPLLLNGMPVGSARVSGNASIRYSGWSGAIRIDERVDVSGFLSP